MQAQEKPVSIISDQSEEKSTADLACTAVNRDEQELNISAVSPQMFKVDETVHQTNGHAVIKDEPQSPQPVVDAISPKSTESDSRKAADAVVGSLEDLLGVPEGAPLRVEKMDNGILFYSVTCIGVLGALREEII